MVIYIATGNSGKAAEIRPLIETYLRSFLLTNFADATDEFQLETRAPKDADEIENTFLGNALIKAKALASELKSETKKYPFAVLSDDSGLEVKGIDGRPGVHSARYAGDHAEASKNIEKLLFELHGKNKADRECRYVCALTLWIQIDKDKHIVFESEGYCSGTILEDAQGSGGFGYDPVFWVPQFEKRMSEATLEEKNSLSHRAQAFETLKAVLKNH